MTLSDVVYHYQQVYGMFKRNVCHLGTPQETKITKTIANILLESKKPPIKV